MSEQEAATPIEAAARGPYQLLPPLAPEVAAQLEASIRARGVEEPVWVDEGGCTLDGHHRRAIADRLGVPYETRVAAGLSEEDKRLFAIRKNTERRQLTRAQRALVAMRAEPSFRKEAKARQARKGDAEQRRVWAAAEAANLVGLPLSTFKRYRELVAEARLERGAEETDSAIERGAWDVGELAGIAGGREDRKERERREAERRLIREQQEKEAEARRAAGGVPALTPHEQEAAQQWNRRGLLGKGADLRAPTDDDGRWECPGCGSLWPEETQGCTRCDAPRPTPGRAAMVATPFGPVGGADPVDQEPRPTPAARIPSERRLGAAQTTALYSLRDDHRLPFLGLNPDELAPLVVAEWQARHVTAVRDRVRQLSGWLASFDAALGNAVLNAGDEDAAEQS